MHGAAHRTFRLDHATAASAAVRSIGPRLERLADRLYVDEADARALSDALVGAFVDGSVYAAVELTAQMVEAGEPAYLEQDVVLADAPDDHGEPV
jgi:hypothetical protein